MGPETLPETLLLVYSSLEVVSPGAAVDQPALKLNCRTTKPRNWPLPTGPGGADSF